MNSQILGLRVAGIIFGLISLGQLLRLVIRPEVLVAGHQLPLWPSALAFLILSSMSLWMREEERGSVLTIGTRALQ